MASGNEGGEERHGSILGVGSEHQGRHDLSAVGRLSWRDSISVSGRIAFRLKNECRVLRHAARRQQ